MKTIDKLRDLQNLDLVIHQLHQRLHEIPVFCAKLLEDFKRKEERMVGLEKESKKLQVAQKEAELEIAGHEEEIKKLSRKIPEVKTNKEYSALLSEIEGFKKKISEAEDRVIGFMDRVTEIKKGIKEEEKIIGSERKLIEEQTRKLSSEETGLKEQLAEEEKKRPVLAEAISRETLAVYVRILESKGNRKAVVEVIHDSCSGCHFRLPTTTVDQLRKGTELVFCEGCSRILYI